MATTRDTEWTDLVETSDAPSDRPVDVLDVRGLNPPEPLRQTLEQLEADETGVLVQLNDRAPKHLFPMLDERGVEHRTMDVDDVTVTLLWYP